MHVVNVLAVVSLTLHSNTLRRGCLHIFFFFRRKFLLHAVHLTDSGTSAKIHRKEVCECLATNYGIQFKNFV